MASQQQDTRVVIFESAHDGYGDARRHNLPYIFPRSNRRPYSYNRVFGSVDTRWIGEISPGVQHTTLGAPNTASAGAIFAKEWEDTVPNPLLIAVYPTTRSTNGEVITVQSGVVTEEAALGARPTGAALHDDGAGVPYLYIAMGGTSAAKVQKRNRAGTTSACTNIYADKLLSINNDLYLSFTPASGTANCAAGKVAAGTAPTSAAQPSATIVGFAGMGINNIAADGTGMIPVYLKPDGIFTYDRALDVWRNRVSSWVTHPDNGKAFWYEDGDLCVALGQGGAVRFNGTDVQPYDPIPLTASPNMDTTGQVISAAGNMRHWGALVAAAGSKRQRTSGTGLGASTSRVDVGVTTDGTTYTDYSANASDGNPTTAVTLSGLSTVGANDWIIIGHPMPFVGIYFDILAGNIVTGSALTVDIWDGSAWVNVNAVTDLTSDFSPAAPFSRSGWLMMRSDPVALGWVPGTFTVGASKSRYWARVSYASNGPLTTPTTVKAVELLPYRPSIDPVEFADEGLDRAGVYPHLLLSRISDDGEHVTHDYGYIVQGMDEVGAVVYGPGGDAHSDNDRSLFLFGMYFIYGLRFPIDDRPTLGAWHTLETQGLVEFAAIDLGYEATIEDFAIDCADWNATGYLYYHFNDGRPWTRAATFTTAPVRKTINDDRSGRYLTVAIAWTMGIAQIRSNTLPRILRIDCQPRPATQQRGRLPAQIPPIV